MDVSILFRACVKTVSLQEKNLGSSSLTKPLKKTRNKSAFYIKTQAVVGQITKLKEFILENRKAYLNFTNYLTNIPRMTDADRDQIDAGAQTIMSTCSQLIKELKREIAFSEVSRQNMEHREIVLLLIEDYLKNVCKIYSEQKAMRVKRAVEMRTISKLELDGKLNKVIAMDNKRSASNITVKTNNNTENQNNSSKSNPMKVQEINEDVNTLLYEELSPEDIQMFESENEQLYNELSTITEEVRQIESKVVHIAELQEIFTEKVLDQDKDLDRLMTTVVGSTENVKEANEQIRHDDVRGPQSHPAERPHYGPTRPGGYNGYGSDSGGIIGGGYIGEGGVYNTRPFGTSGGPIIGRPPLISRCDEQDNFRQVGPHTRVRKPFVRRYTTASSLAQCERECADARDFVCRSFNYRPYAAPYGAERDNCELSDRDSRDMDMGNPIYYDTGSDYDFYERNNGRQGADGECLDVSQVCSEDGMEFTLRTPEGFIGRIYTYGYYDRCFFRGNGGTVNVLRISGPQGYPECGTQRYGDTMTNIVVVQFSDYVQTGRDKRFNLTCLFRGPGEAVVTSGYIGAGSGSPIPIEYLPAENTLSSRVRLLILYQGRPTTTIAVGDPLTFRLEAQEGYNYVTDIFATNVIARDPYSGRSVQLIDRYGCPVDNYVFPGLDRLRDGDSLEARFNAFKIPESNFLVFEATVRTCRDGCQPAYCSGGSGRSEPSFGRKRRDLSNDTALVEDNLTEAAIIENDNNVTVTSNSTYVMGTRLNDGNEEEEEENEESEEEHVREMIEVLDSRMDIEEEETMVEKQSAVLETVCIAPNEYYGLVTAVGVLVVLLASVVLLSMLVYRKHAYSVIMKNRKVDKAGSRSNHSDDATYSSRVNNFSFMRSGLQKPFQSTSISRSMSNIIGQRMSSSSTALEGAVGLSTPRRSGFDPSEPIYTDPSLFEVNRCSQTMSKQALNDNFHLM